MRAPAAVLAAAVLAAALLLVGCAGKDRPAWAQRTSTGAPAAAAVSRPAVAGAPPATAAGPRPASPTAVERSPLPPLPGTAASAAGKSGSAPPATATSFPASPPAVSAPAVRSLDTPGGAAGKMVAAATPAARPADPAWTGVETHSARHEDTLLDIAVNRGMGFIEIAMANPDVDPWLPGEGTAVMLPKQHLLPDAPHQGLVLNLPEQRLYHFQNGKLARSYPIGIGRDGHATPIGSTSVVRKAVDPVWRPTPSARADDPELPAMVPAGPDNPLGSRALYLGWTSYLIHGTNKEYGIGRRASRGCIRMYDNDVRALYEKVAVGTPVTAVDQPVKVGWIGEELYIEASPTIAQVRQWEEEKRFDPVDASETRQLINSKAGMAIDRIDWATVDRALSERRGIVTRITRPAATRPVATAALAPPPTTAAAAGSTATATAMPPSAASSPPPPVPLAATPPGRTAATPTTAGTAPPPARVVLPTASPAPAATVPATPPRPQTAAVPAAGGTKPAGTAAAAGAGKPAVPTAGSSSGSAEPTGDELVKWLRGRLSAGDSQQ